MLFHLPYSDLLAADPSEYESLVAGFHWKTSDREDTKQLRDLLRHWEVKAGRVTSAHHEATRRLRAQGGWRLHLKNPMVHNAGLTCFAMQPKGGLFATGNFAPGSGDYSGPFVIWEMETGRCLVDVPLEGGPGYPGRQYAMQWAPEEEALGFTFQMGWMGAMNPFRGGKSEELDLGESKHDEGPAFCWMPDGESLFVAAFPPKDEDDDDYDDDEDDYADDEEESTPRGFWFSFAENGEVSGFEPSAQRIEGIPHLDVCRAYGSTIVGLGRGYSVLYVISKVNGLTYSEKADRIWLGKDHFLAYRDGKLEVVEGQSCRVVYEMPMDRPRYCTSAGTAEDLVILIDRGHSIEVRKRGGEVTILHSESGIAEAPWTLPDLQSCAVSPDGRSIALLTGDGHAEVWKSGTNWELSYRAHFPKAQGIFLNDQGTMVLAAPDWLGFVDYSAGKILSEYHLARPEQPSFLQANKSAAHLLMDYPSCSISVNGKPEWAYVFDNGSVVIPAELNADDHFAYVADERWAWPLRWDNMPVYSTILDLCQDPRNGLKPDFVKAIIAAAGSR